MNKSGERLDQLIRNYFGQVSTEAEEQELWSYVNDDVYADDIKALLPDAFNSNSGSPSAGLGESEKQRVLQFIFTQNTGKQAKHRRLWPRIATAASILLFLSAGSYFLLHKAKPQQQIVQTQKPDLQPGSKKAILLLSGGKVISLGDAKAGTIATQGNTNITKTADNKIVYSNSATPATEVVYNTIITKRGNYYPLTMSDGTVAILDAASSIKYPVNFTGHERRVEITGQVYFEVVHNANMPFRVTVKGQTIEDMGTHFNINAYDDEPAIKTTLIEGHIRINHQVILAPGEQAVIKNGIIKVAIVNTEQAIAWKNGLFSFKGTPMAEAMRQLSRWYNVDVEYPNGLPKTNFTGEMHRNINASQVLDMLSYFNVHFQIVADSDGKKIIVKP